MFNIWSIEHGRWWKPYATGYTSARNHAGAYTFAEAAQIVREANAVTQAEIMLPVEQERPMVAPFAPMVFDGQGIKADRPILPWHRAASLAFDKAIELELETHTPQEIDLAAIIAAHDPANQAAPAVEDLAS